MTPVMQSKLWTPDAIHNGNCFAACLASLLDLPLWMVPPFEDMFGRRAEWRERVDQWLARVHHVELVKHDGHPDDLPEYYIACGPSPRGVDHAVIFTRGTLAHDPHPSGAGLVRIDWCWTLAVR